MQCRRAVVQGFTVLIQLPGSVLHLIHGVPQGRHTIGKFIQILVEIFEAVIELPNALIHIIHAVLQIIHAVRKIVGVLQVVRVQILQQSRCNDGSRKLQLEIFGVCAHFHILWNVDVLGHLIAGQLQTVRQARHGASDDHALVVHVHQFSIGYFDVGEGIGGQYQSRHDQERGLYFIGFFLYGHGLCSCIFIVEANCHPAAFSGQPFRAYLLAVQIVGDFYPDRRLCVAGSLIGDVRAVIFPDEASVGALRIFLVAPGVTDVLQVTLIPDIGSIGRVLQGGFHRDFLGVSFRI